MSEIKKKTIKFKDNELYLKVSQYKRNWDLAILAYTKDDFYGDITINLPAMFLGTDEGFINSITKDSGLEKVLLKKGIIKEIIGPFKYNYGTYDKVVFDLEKLKEYDAKGVEEYENLINEQEEEIEEEE